MELAPVEYYYGDILRWGFGFENPNKAAVVFACALPLFWLGWSLAWRIQSRIVKMILLVVSGGGFLGTVYCLTMTFSRGGLVAALAGLVYGLVSQWLGRNNGGPAPRLQKWLSLVLLISVIAIPVVKGLGSRSAEALTTNDASVGNRAVLWKFGLQMAYENPRGLGAGHSGDQYMQWYQHLAMTMGYRTMVNSYLTYLVEHGWAVWLVTLAAVGMVCGLTAPPSSKMLPEIALGLRSTIAAFAVAGLFSSVMEEPRLWILPTLCLLGLLAIHFLTESRWQWRSVIYFWSLAVAASAALLAAGWWQHQHDFLTRSYSAKGFITSIQPKGLKGLPTVGVNLEQKVLGSQYGKLLRQLAVAGYALQMESGAICDIQLMLGDATHGLSGDRRRTRLYLIAPRVIPVSEAENVVQGWKRVFLLLPDIDEDGRTSFWEHFAATHPADSLAMESLRGVGTQIDWAWPQVIESLRNGILNTESVTEPTMSTTEPSATDDTPPQLPPLPDEGN